MKSKRASVDIHALLRHAGLRVTPSRVAVLKYLRQSHAPQSHSDIVRMARANAADRVTIYRNLLDFVRVGLARRIDAGDHVWRFEASQKEKQHAHFICTDCGDIECLPELAIDLRQAARMPRALRKKQVEVQLKGVCDNCT